MKVNELLTLICNSKIALIDQESDYFITDSIYEMATKYGDYEIQAITVGKVSNTLYIAINY